MIIGLSIPIEVFLCCKKNSFFDRIIRMIVFVGTAIPDYWLSLLFLISVFALKLNLFPISGADTMKGYILPAFALSMSYISTYIRLIRNNMIETLGRRLHLLFESERNKRKFGSL